MARFVMPTNGDGPMKLETLAAGLAPVAIGAALGVLLALAVALVALTLGAVMPRAVAPVLVALARDALGAVVAAARASSAGPPGATMAGRARATVAPVARRRRDGLEPGSAGAQGDRSTCRPGRQSRTGRHARPRGRNP